MRVLTYTLDSWDGDAWLVELDTPIRPILRRYEEVGDEGILRIQGLRRPITRYVAVVNTPIPNEVDTDGETYVYAVYASGECQYRAENPEPIAGGLGFSHVDALDDLASRFDGVTVDVDGERTPEIQKLIQMGVPLN